MEWEAEERDAWVSDAERWICDLQGVLESKIELDDRGEIAGIHVVAGMERDPRRIVRDVEGLLKTRLQMDVYYKKIGVVQVVENVPAGAAASEPQAAAGGVTFHPPGGGAAAPEPEPAARNAVRDDRRPVPAVLVAEDASPRLVCSGVSIMSSDRMVRAEVQLQAGPVEAGGICEGTNHADSDLQLVARATLEAVGHLLATPMVLHLREIRVEPVADQDLILTAVELVEARRSETLFGSCAARHNRQQAVVHSVLDALNRRLGLQGFKAGPEAAGTG